MKVVIACDSFKGSCSSIKAARSISAGIRKVYPEAVIESIPVSDGGEGMLEAVLEGTQGTRKYVNVKDPLGRNRKASFVILKNGRAVIEMAEASGLTLLKETERDPLNATSYGTGELIRAALEEGCREILVGIGGSATNDGGVGMAQALGASFLDNEGRELPYGGKALGRLARIDLTGMDARLAGTRIIVASDVANPLCGKRGASYVYGPQKGATPKMAQLLDESLGHLADIAKERLNLDIRDREGAGAAGGMGGGLMLFCGAQMKSGISAILDIVDFDSKISDADIVITGEGRMDAQSAYGKAPVGIARRVKRQRNIPVFALVGGVGDGAEAVYKEGIDAVLGITKEPVSLKYAMENAEGLLQETAEQLMRVVRAAGN